MSYELPELVTAFGILGGGIGAAGLGLKFAAPVVALLRRAAGANGNGSSYEKGKDMGTLLVGIDRQTAALGDLTTEIHELAVVNRQVLAHFDTTLEDS